jgi:hypothetical protein
MLYMTDLPEIQELSVVLRNTGNTRQPGGLGVLRGGAECVAEEARTRGFASQTLVRFAFIAADYRTFRPRVNSGNYQQIIDLV